MPTSDRVWWLLAIFGLAAALTGGLAACSREPDNAQLAEVEASQARDAAAAGRVACALAGAPNFRTDCTLDRVASAQGTVLVIGREDVGYRRFRTMAGRGVVAADGAEPARVSIVDGGMIEVAVANDRYRLPATVGGAGAGSSARSGEAGAQ